VSELGEEKGEETMGTKIKTGSVMVASVVALLLMFVLAWPSPTPAARFSGADSAFVNVLTVDAGPVARDDDDDDDDDGDHGCTICISIGL